MIKIYNPDTLLEAQCLKDLLLSHNLFCHIAGVDLMGAVGELPVMGLLGLCVEDQDAGRAKELIDDYLSAEPVSDEDE